MLNRHKRTNSSPIQFATQRRTFPNLGMRSSLITPFDYFLLFFLCLFLAFL